MVYFITDGDCTKIGVAKNPNKRLAQLQTGNPNKLVIAKVIQGGYHEERALHEALKDRRLEGEWFLFNDFDDVTIKGLLDSVGYEPEVIDTKPCVHIHEDLLPVIGNLNHRAFRVLIDVMKSPYSDEVELYPKALADNHGLSNTRDILAGVKELLQKEIIFKKSEKHKYEINTRLLFNGNRTFGEKKWYKNN